MKRKYLVLIFIILLLLFSTIAAAGFWQDITGMFSFSLSKLFKKKISDTSISSSTKESAIRLVQPKRELSLMRPAIRINEDMYEHTLILNYKDSLINDKGLVFYFNYDGWLYQYSMKYINGGNYLIDFFIIAYYPSQVFSDNVYSNGERFTINSFNDTAVNMTLHRECDQSDDKPYCIYTPHSGRFILKDYPFLKYYIDSALFSSDDLLNQYSETGHLLDLSSLNILNSTFGFFPPIDQIISFQSLTATTHEYSDSSGFFIRGWHNRQLTEEDIAGYTYGNAHEFVHVFFYGLPVYKSWFEEGLANYIQHFEQNQLSNLFCFEEGWQEGYFDRWGRYVNNTPLVLYSNFRVLPSEEGEFYNPLRRNSYYRSAECFWVYINNTYGHGSIKRIALELNNLRKQIPPRQVWLIDVIHSAIGVDFSSLVQNRYSEYYPLLHDRASCSGNEECMTRNCINVGEDKQCEPCSTAHPCPSRFDLCVERVCKRANNGRCYGNINCISGYCKKVPTTAIAGLCTERPTLMGPSMSLRTMS